ncbi:Rab geranylgeranyltransferase [Paraconiothyrium brasiliense]|uniref:Geranylgeranyl transferase type-2 subunit alpha n=1 Tax=Paraconiothyrium brasiliense TaxID=300254 RepID=A0ABR3RRG4_9PLEO
MASHGITRTAGTAVRTEEARQQQLRDIDAYKELVDLVSTKITERQYTLEVLGLLTKLLKQNPEYYTVWNHRRRVLNALFRSGPAAESKHDVYDLLQNDLQLTFALLRQYPKCYWIWNHRNWLLETAEPQQGAEVARQLWSGELLLVNKMLGADSRNFHAWGYRRFVTAQIERLTTSTDGEAPQSMTEMEFEYTSSMIRSNLSNFSAWHHRSKVIPRLLNLRDTNPDARQALLDSELALICEAINTDPFDQSIWFYHQYLMSTLSPKCPSEDRIVINLDNGDRQRYYENEMQYIREILEDEEDCKWIYEGLLFLAGAYLEVEGGTKVFTTADLRSWLEQLKRLDPLRKGRWDDLGQSLDL